jgi:hypothetical protein
MYAPSLSARGGIEGNGEITIPILKCKFATARLSSSASVL